MVALCPDNMIGKRDRALLCLGFAGAFRRSELCALEVADLTEVPDGLRILIRRSKGDQEGQGQEVAIPRGYKLRPVEAVQTWLAAAGDQHRPGVPSSEPGRTGIGRRHGGRQRGADREAVCAARVGLDPASYAGHSLRSGFLTSAAESGRLDLEAQRSIPGISRWIRCAAMCGGSICSRSTQGRRSCNCWGTKPAIR